ncbi:site-specific integrase [Azospirillum doebereinerae]|uniref:DUF6538 domain-containing protein n=1 Tax=Azospirillum doebereinerae TaxID=92933 RepID=UPI001EE5EC43|nr:site-specific integrase [Azospirillum doebereinerae]
MAGRKTAAGRPKSGDWRHIVERGGRLYLRLRVPADVQAHFGGRSHLERALGTSDIVSARRERNRLLPVWEVTFEEARALPAPEQYVPVLERYGLTGPVTPERIRRLKDALRLEAEITEDADEAFYSQARQSARGWVNSLSDGEIEALRARALYGHRAPVLVGQEARPVAAFAPTGIVAPDEALAEIERVEGAAAPEQAVAPGGGVAGHTIWQTWNIYVEDRKPPAKTAHEWKRSLEIFEDAMGAEPAPPRVVEEITREHVRQYARFLRARPSGRGGAVSDDTVNKRISALRSVLEIAVESDWIAKNPASGLTQRSRKTVTKTKRLPLLVSEIETVQAKMDCTDRDYWIWVLLRYTGARLGEIVQLHKDDVKRHHDGTWYIRIHDEGERHVKTSSSVRDVPLHVAVAEGFLSWVQSRPAGALWPDDWKEVPADGGGTRLAPSPVSTSKRLNRRLRTAGVTDPRKTLHSLRHAFKDMLRHVCGDEELRDAILGHTGSATVGRRYGEGHYLRRLAEVINMIDPAEIRRLQLINVNPWQEEVS